MELTEDCNTWVRDNSSVNLCSHQNDQRIGPLAELITLPDGIGVIPLFNNVRYGKIEEFKSANSGKGNSGKGTF